MVYGTPQSGGNPVSSKNVTLVAPGQTYTLFDGTESAAQGLASAPFVRGNVDGIADNGTTFLARGIPSGCTIDIQVANTDAAANYTSVTTMTPDANGNAAYTDSGRATFYRASLSAYTSGAMPIVEAGR